MNLVETVATAIAKHDDNQERWEWYVGAAKAAIEAINAFAAATYTPTKEPSNGQ